MFDEKAYRSKSLRQFMSRAMLCGTVSRQGVCRIQGCDHTVYRQFLCRGHYVQQRTNPQRLACAEQLGHPIPRYARVVQIEVEGKVALTYKPAVVVQCRYCGSPVVCRPAANKTRRTTVCAECRRSGLGGRNKLNEVQVTEIKSMIREGLLTKKCIGAMYGVTRQVIRKIQLGKIWKHVEAKP